MSMVFICLRKGLIRGWRR